MKRFFLQIITGILGIFLAVEFVSGIELKLVPHTSFLGIKITSPWQALILIGTALGLANFFIKPILNFLTSPLRILTFGLFSLVINMGIVWGVSLFFRELIIDNLSSLFWGTIIIWGLSLILSFLFRKSR